MSASTRPMYRKYADAWRLYSEKYGPRTAVLYQVGGFFEIYDTENLTTGATEANIREIAELCQLSLTVHPVVGDTAAQTLFGGFPEHSLAKFERILIQAGFTVVVIVQRKNAAGVVEERVVEHISSPGCYVDAGAVRERRLVGIVAESLASGGGTGGETLRRVYWAATAIDVATGRIWFVEGTDRDRLHQFLCIHPPAELVVWTDGGSGAAALTEDLRSAVGSISFHVRCLTAGSAAIDEATLDRFWAPCRTRLDWIARLPQARRSLAALMEFAADHLPSALAVLGLPEAWIPGGEVRLGNAALEQLGVLSLRGDGDRQSLLAMMDECRSVAGRRLLRSRLLRPICDVAELNARLDRVDAATTAAENPERTAATERGLRSLYDLSRLWRRLELGSATVGDLACFVRSYEAVAGLVATGGWSGSLNVDAQALVTWVLGRWDAGILTEMAREGVTVPVAKLPWSAGLRPTVETVFAEGQAVRAEAVALCQKWSALGRGEPLYLDDAEGGGFRITGTKRRVAAVLTALRDAGDTTAVVTTYKSTASLEAGVLEALSTRHRAWFGRWHGVWAETWAAVQAEVVERGAGGVAAAVEAWCAELDVAWTVSRLARDWLWKRPIFLDGAEGMLEVTRLRHPILERLTTVPYVSHSVRLGSGATTVVDASADQGLLLYGMNASGKSSLMKAIGLAVLLAQCGFPVPAATCRLVPFTAIFTRILGNDNLWAGQSSFVVEMTEFRDILRFSDARSLVLGDELCKGTESFSATALVAAGVETLAARRSKFVFATHLHELATLPDIAGLAGVRPYHLRVSYDAATDRLVYGRDLVAGAGSALYGLEVCRALDLPTGYLDRAMALRQSLAGWEAPHTST